MQDSWPFTAHSFHAFISRNALRSLFDAPGSGLHLDKATKDVLPSAQSKPQSKEMPLEIQWIFWYGVCSQTVFTRFRIPSGRHGHSENWWKPFMDVYTVFLSKVNPKVLWMAMVIHGVNFLGGWSSKFLAQSWGPETKTATLQEYKTHKKSHWNQNSVKCQ